MAQGFSDGGFADVDPFMRHLRQSVTPFEHDDITYGPEPRAVELMRRRSDFGFASGLSVPIYGPTGRVAAVFKGPTRTLLPHEKRAFHLITLHAFDRICRLRSPQPAQRRVLTNRQREVLTWAAAGKSAWEMGEILGISSRTVEEHAQQALGRLGAVNRTQAVAIAIRDRLIAI
jgi:LuxR family transcriptional regulator, quorum-sensing system regulator BjaR1